ncbi:MAG: response regulator transcription factor [Anaerolineae bacterium]|nr:response regulator transcription factor [Anaerolineae bacterium]
MNHTTLLIVDDHTVVRKGIQMIVSTEPSIKVIGEAADGPQAFEQVKALRPDIVLMDLLMPNDGGLKAITKIKKSFPTTKIIVLTTYVDKQKVTEAMSAGADGYLLKEVDGQALLDAILHVRQGEMPLHPKAVTYLFKNEPINNAIQAETAQLTEREMDVLKLVSEGLTNKEIAHDLNLSIGTIKVHVSNILSKLQVTSRTAASVRATQSKLIPERSFAEI